MNSTSFIINEILRLPDRVHQKSMMDLFCKNSKCLLGDYSGKKPSIKDANVSQHTLCKTFKFVQVVKICAVVKILQSMNHLEYFYRKLKSNRNSNDWFQLSSIQLGYEWWL